MTWLNKLTFIIGALLVVQTARAQTNSRMKFRASHSFDLSASYATGMLSAALAWSHEQTLIRKIPNLKIGYGLRLTSFVAANKYYTTAPSKYTSPVQNLGTIFSKTIASNIDTITTSTTSTNSLNASISIHYTITKSFDVGFNIDAIGFSFGSHRQFNVISTSFDANQSSAQTALPTPFNLLLTSDNDIGSLNSEFFLRYWPTNKLGIKAGYTFLFSEYQTVANLVFDGGRISNDRYRYKASMLLLGLTYRPFRSK